MKTHRLIACLLLVIGSSRVLANPGSGTLNLVTGQPGINTLNVTVSASASGLTASDTQTTTATGSINASFDANPATGATTAMTITGGAFQMTDMQFRLRAFLGFTVANVTTANLRGTAFTPPPVPAPVSPTSNGGTFNASLHRVLINQGNITGAITATNPDMPINSDFTTSPVEGSGSGNGTVTMIPGASSPSQRTMQVTLEMPVDFTDNLNLSGTSVTIRVQGTIRASGAVILQKDASTISNHSFEDPPVATGAFDTLVTDWQDLGAAGDNGVFRGNGDFGQAAKPTDGLNMAFMNDIPTAALVQTLATTYQAGRDYSLKVDIASRNPPIDLDDGATLVLYKGNITAVSGLTAANIVATFFVNSASELTTDVFNTFTLTATAAQIAAVSGVGQPIGIGIVGGILGGAATNRTQNYDLDNVRFNSNVAAPSVPFTVKVSQSGNALDFEWTSISGKQYDLLSSTGLTTHSSTWLPYNDGVTTHENIPAAGTTTTRTGVLKNGPVRFFVVREEAP